MFLSRIQLNVQRRDARWLLSSPQRLHAAVLSAFADPPTGSQDGRPRVLWRLDHDQSRVFLYVVSPDEPDFAHIAEQAGWPTTERGLVRPYQPLLDRLEVGQSWAFRLAANPTRYERPSDGGPARRVGHVSVFYQEEWLRERAMRSGFAIAQSDLPAATEGEGLGDDLVTTRREVVAFKRRDASVPGNGRKAREVTLSTVQFDGRLVVTDVEALRSALVAGIGPGKAYGCGLLTLASR